MNQTAQITQGISSTSSTPAMPVDLYEPMTPPPYHVNCTEDLVLAKDRGGHECVVAMTKYMRDALFIERACNSHHELLDALRVAKAALSHDVPGSCWATGPSTGDVFEDLVVCPGCRAMQAIDVALSRAIGAA